MNHEHEHTDELRRRLADQAAQAPADSGLSERIIAQATAAEQSRGRTPWNTTWLRLVAVAAAVIAVAGVAVAVTQHRSGPERDQADRTLPVPSSTAPLTSGGSTSSTTVSPRTSDSPNAASPSRLLTVPTLTGVRVLDITFTGGGDGWGLASADCLRSTGRCTALLRTTDGGKVWQSRPNTPFHVAGVDDCSAPCVTNIRFATDDIGYAFGRSALFMTTDGAQSWRRLAGGADALETLDGNVIRVRSDAGSCPPGCTFTAQVADLGSADWRTVDLPGRDPGNGVALSRSGSHAYLLATGNPAGGAQDARSTLWTSADDGRSWRNRGEPCAQRGGEVDAGALTTAADGTVVVVCRQRGGGQAQAVAISTDDGASFTTGPFALGADRVAVVAAASARTVLVGADDTYRSSDGGRRFERGDDIGATSYLGFSSGTDAHAISADGRTIYTSSDAGKRWLAVRFR